MTRFYSFIVPVYDRPEELAELLSSLAGQRYGSFEVVIVEDGSDVRSDRVVDEFRNKLKINYISLPRSGPSVARNSGMQAAQGDYLLFVDSDCLVPPDYLKTVNDFLNGTPVDFFGGPDKAAGNFNLTQKAISYAMTSFLTTGGIRGGKKQVDKFYPRSFNMGISREAFRTIGGFPDTRMHPGEDMVFAIELIKRGIKSGLIQDAYVYHKRRTSFGKFYRQVRGFGKTRYIISKVYPDTFRIFFLFPTIFVLGVAGLLILSLWISWLFIFPVLLWIALIFVDASVRNRNLMVGLMAVWASMIQMAGYGLGFLSAWIKKGLLGQDEYGVFTRGFYTR
jgi:glycosyltransferase involved in cell wall biosynthesis